MYPWIWLWAPNFYFPLSGAVDQTIQPDLFDSIDPRAGNGSVERRAFQVASYGRQLGLITEVLLDIARKQETMSTEAKESMKCLEGIQGKIEKIKEDESTSIAAELDARLLRLKTQDPNAFSRLRTRLLAIVKDDS
ncbi:hypothetical protein [Burkholderia thailandensis]|uniref:Uncharacterized protein n=2 Tax=Burkholderia thailandensis TaxID=57975 RepID=A0AAW9CZ68_BURTH|nr:hypothetical protein [Burkholderia thailandensis]ABC34640.1 conserved hypothetical protein [Burkholderia thailandensis E264]AHI66423.1 hypothetical protein BTL_4758 [Burkholderia thailandensis H0587]AHI77179.1 hypothetical protein BTQ_5272 [Burkholderia thailandensis 2002721723]AHI81595.1 hypothetical protein BTJ_3905 [Burkholderia thailandensis E444]AIC89127.1 hypothetical protein BTRA_4664 [Burkholderia thailandensis USAMRU Malaysia \